MNKDIIINKGSSTKNSEIKITNTSIKIDRYELYTNYEEENNIRGIALYIQSNLKRKFCTISKENMWCTLKLNDNDKLLLGCI